MVFGAVFPAAVYQFTGLAQVSLGSVSFFPPFSISGWRRARAGVVVENRSAVWKKGLEQRSPKVSCQIILPGHWREGGGWVIRVDAKGNDE
jgi:hypothetical protein